jgi:hypothetical protein
MRESLRSEYVAHLRVEEETNENRLRLGAIGAAYPWQNSGDAGRILEALDWRGN